MNQETFSEKEALGVIEEMVNSSRYKLKKEAKYFLLWGWMVFLSAILHFIAIQTGVANAWIIWPVMMGLTSVIYGAMIVRSNGEPVAKTYVDRVNRYLWSGFFGPLVITLLVGIFYSWPVAYPFFMAIYGWAAIISGGLLKFRPLVWGGIISCAIGLITIFVPDMYILIMLALAILSGFIIPGHALRKTDS